MPDPTSHHDDPLRLLIADDQPLIRRGLAMMLATESGIEVVGQAADGMDAIQQAMATPSRARCWSSFGC